MYCVILGNNRILNIYDMHVNTQAQMTKSIFYRYCSKVGGEGEVFLILYFKIFIQQGQMGIIFVAAKEIIINFSSTVFAKFHGKYNSENSYSQYLYIKYVRNTQEKRIHSHPRKED